jgi:hypothetical protein
MCTQLLSHTIPEGPITVVPGDGGPSEPVRKTTSLGMEPLLGLLLDERPEEGIEDFDL